MGSSTMAAAWRDLTRFRHRDLLRGALLRAFERDQLESRVIQSEKFQPLLGRWADVLAARASGKAGDSIAEADPQDVPAEIVKEAQKIRDPEVRWLVRRLQSGDLMNRGPAHFPSTFMVRGPSYPFQPFEFNYLKTKTGSIRGTELNEPIELPEVKSAEVPEDLRRPRDLWNEGCLDDEDHMDHTRPLR